MNDTERIATLRAALEKAHLRGNYCTGLDVIVHDAAIDAALAATAEPATYELRDGERRAVGAPEWSDPFRAPSPAPRDVHLPDCVSRLDDESDHEHLADAGTCTCGASPAPRDTEREALLAFGRSAYSKGYSRGVEESSGPDEMPYMGPDRMESDLAALLPVKP